MLSYTFQIHIQDLAFNDMFMKVRQRARPHVEKVLAVGTMLVMGVGCRSLGQPVPR
jgi:hypothetical protein